MTRENEQAGPGAWALWHRNGAIWLALMVLLFLSLNSAYLHLGPWTTVIGIVIAVIKAALVAVLFMELAHAKALTRLAALGGLVFLSAMFLLTLADVLSRVAPR